MSSPLVRIGAFSDVGRIRNMNEDAYVVTDQVFMVADGMGGHLAGEVASAMAVEAMGSLSGAITAEEACHTVIEANLDILRLSIADSSKRGMGTTLTGLALVTADDGGANRIAVVNVGDSRTYRLRSGKLTQISIDHSYVQELIFAGHISKAEAREHPQRNIVTRALGIEPGVGVDLWSLPLVIGDRFMACSDGLVDEIDDGVIELVLRGTADPQEAAEELVRLANAAGGHDNTTVVVVDVLEGIPADDADDDNLGAFITMRADPAAFENADTSEFGDDRTSETDLADVPSDPTPTDDGVTTALADRDITVIEAPSASGDDPTPLGDAERSRRNSRANTSFIVYGFVVALIALLVVVIVALSSGSDDDEPVDTTPATEVPVDSMTSDSITSDSIPADFDPTATVAGLDDATAEG